MLTKDQKERLSLLRTMISEDIPKKDALEALEKNYWDTAMAKEWLSKKEEGISLEDFHSSYDEARNKAVILPSDRYDVPTSKKNEGPTNRKQRRAAKKEKKKK